MSMPATSSTTPKAIDTMVRALLDILSLAASTARWLDYQKPEKFIPEPNECHINAWLQLKYNAGSVCSGWTIWQHEPTQFVEAEFHTVWRNDEGVMIDVTPRQDGEKMILFVPDPLRVISLTNYNGCPAIKSYDNVRIRSGQLQTDIREQVRVLTTRLIYEHGLVG